MSRKPISMRKIKEILRLNLECCLSERQIASSCKVARTTVQDYLSRARAIQLTWQQVCEMPEDVLEQKLFPVKTPTNLSHSRPDWATLHLELKRPDVTLQLLWEEYLVQNPSGYCYSQFCHLYRQFSRTTDVTMRHVHKFGDKLFVDYSGKTAEVIDQATGEIRYAQIFVAVLGASNYTYAEATWTQQIPDWVGSHVRAFKFFGGVPSLVVPDNLKSGVTKPWFYEPDINPTYADLARHYNLAVLPAKAYKPRYKAKVECGVLIVQRWILACLRHRRIFSLVELNIAIQELLEKLNQRPFKKLQGSRKSLFESLEKPALKPLPADDYELAEWKKASVNIDYHVEFRHRYYSVPYKLARQSVELRATASTIEIFHRGNRVASHMRDSTNGAYSTLDEHMPPKHKFCQWNAERFIGWAEKYGPSVMAVIKVLLNSRIHPEQAFRACLGILKQADKVGKDRLNAACERALHFGSPTCKTVINILMNNQDRLLLPEKLEETPVADHCNIRGPKYYQNIN